MLLEKLFSGLIKNSSVKKEEVPVANTQEEKHVEAESSEKGPVITIAREFGSGGREIAMKVAEKLGYDFYDKEKIIEVAKQNGIDTDLFEQLEQSKIDSFWYQISPNDYDIPSDKKTFEQKVNNDKMFMIQSDTIRNLAKKGNAVFVGRCASYILKADAKKFFIVAKPEDRVKRIEKRYKLSKNKAQELMHFVDKKRERYYDYYTNTKWNAPENYDMVIDVSETGIDGAVETIVKYVTHNEDAH